MRELPAQAKDEVCAELRTYLEGRRFPLISSTDREEYYGYGEQPYNLFGDREVISVIKSTDETVVFTSLYLTFKIYDFLNANYKSSLLHA